ncbi:MAG: response regulator [Desulfovibrio sp.]
MKILLVDDESELVSALAERLSFRGFDAKWASNGDQAIAMAQEETFELALLDVKMPGMCGFTLREKLQVIQPELKFIFLTGHGSEDDFITGSSKSESYLVKPVSIDALVESINAATKGA